MTVNGPTSSTAYWLSRLAGAPEDVRLPRETHVPAGRCHVSVAVPPHVVAAARARARGSDRSLFTLLAAALAVSLERYTRASDLIVAIAPDGSSGPPVPLRVHVDTNASFRSLVLDIHTAIDEAIGSAAGLVEACELLGVVHSTGIPVSCHVGLGMGTADDAMGISGHVETSLVWRITGPSSSLEIAGSAEGPEAFGLARFAEYCLMVLEVGVATPEIALDAIAPIGTADSTALAAFNSTDVSWPAPRDAAHEQFVAQARRTPDAVAVFDAVTTLTYQELDGASEHIAATIGQRALPAESIVAVLPPRDVRWIAALIGIWKAGCAYLPLDLSQTPARIATMIRASNAAAVLASTEDLASVTSILDTLPPSTCPPIVPIESIAQIHPSSAPPALAPAAPVDPKQLAYVIFTSGSTGVPKGAMVEHGGMRNHLAAKIRALALGPGDIVGLTASASFDVSVWQMMAGLLAGSRVYVADHEEVLDQLAQLRAVDRAGITILEVVPSQLRAMLDLVQGPDAPALDSLRRLIVNGEPLGYDLCDHWRSAYPRVPLMNAYGPTECSDDVTHLVLDEWSGEGSVSIGRPLPNTRLYVLDARLRPLPVGVTGEIYVGGTGVGRGYLDDPVRTASSFVPDPFSGTPGARMYRTGDRGRWTGDGSLYCSGRIDHQIKLRGFRIELGDIEAALRRHPEIRDAAVIVSDDIGAGPALVAYVVPHDDRPVAAGELRAFVGETLPDYMVPSVVVALREMPLTPSGKADRRALPAPTAVANAPEAPGVAPRTPVEEALYDIWADLLQRTEFGIHDNFFDLGGHSLAATRVVARVRARIGAELPLRVIFTNPTIAELALAITTLLLDEQHAVASSVVE